MPPINAARAALPKILLLSIAVNLLLLAYYIGVDYQYVFHSDAAAANLLAQEMVETGRFFPPEWNYVNSDIWVFFMQIFVVPFIKFFPNGYWLHAVVSVVSSALVLLGAWLLSGVAGLSRTARIATVALFAAGLSPNMAENLYGQAAYGTMFYSGCFLLYFAWRFLQADGARRWLWGALAMLVALLVFWANPQRAAVYYGMPLVVGALALAWQHRRQPSAPQMVTLARALTLIGALAVTAVIAALLHRHTLSQVNGSAGLTQAQWLGFNDMLENLGGTLRGLLSLLAGLPPPGGQVMGVTGGLHALRLVAALVMLMAIPWALARSLDPRQPGRLFVATGALCTMAVCLFINVTTTIPVQATPEASIRYILPALLAMLVLMVGALFDERGRSRNMRIAGLGAVAVMLLTARTAYLVPEAPGYLRAGDKHTLSYKWRLVDYLESQNLKYGYSNFWSAGQTTVLSGGVVRSRQIQIVNGMPEPRRHLASDRWYAPEAWRGETFLMLNPAEMAEVNWAELKAKVGEPVRRLMFEDWQILVYDHNIAADLPSWDMNISRPIRYVLGAYSAHQAGKFNPDNGALEARPGENGVLLFGPGQRVPGGAYQVTFDIESEGDGKDDFGLLDVTSLGGNKPHAARHIERAGRQRITLPFVLPRRADGMEFRVMSSGAGTLKVYGVELARQPAAVASK